MPKKASVKYKSLRTNFIHLPLSIYASLVQQQARPQGLILHFSPIVTASGSSKTAQEAYLGWSGLAAASSLAGSFSTLGGGGRESVETVEVDPEVAMGLGWVEGTIVEISIIHNPTKAKSVSVTPLSADDWEILEQHASYLEDNLLSQLRAARKGQVLDVWVMGKTKIRIRVDKTDPKTKSAVLANADTEVFVAPRPRKEDGAKEQSRVIEPAASKPSSGSRKGKERAQAVDGVSCRFVPPRVAVQWGDLGLSEGDLESVGSDAVVLCSPTTSRRIRRKLGKEGQNRLYVKLNKRKEEEKPIDGEGHEAETTDEKADAEGPGGWLTVWDEMPEGCVSVTGQLDEEWAEWYTVQITSTTPRKSKSKGSAVALPAFQVGDRVPKTRLAGVDQLLDDATSFFRRAAASAINRPLLLCGAKGSGKTSLANLIAEHLESDREVVAGPQYHDVARLDPNGRVNSIKGEMRSWLETAGQNSPTLLILDNLDSLLPPENELTPSSNTAALANHFCSVFDPLIVPPGVFVLATAVSTSNLHPLLNNKHACGDTMKIKPVTKEVRAEILRTLVQQQTSRVQPGSQGVDKLDFVTLASMTEGYTAADLKDLAGGALQQSLIRSMGSDEQASIAIDDFVSAQAAFTPLSLRGVVLQKSDVKWSDIGGLVEPRRVLRETLEWPTRYAQIFANCPLRLRSGLLLYGFPGCGKTMLASAVAKECGLNFISVKGPEILNKYIGASEKSVRDLFERASAAKPCVLFFDEFDSIAPKRGHDSTGVTDRVVNQLLTEMDGAQGLEGVYVLAATSRPDLIDPALLRPGRLDKSLLCDMPSADDRLEILKAVSSKLTFAPSIDFDVIASDTEGFSGADLQAMVYNAHLEVVHESIDASERKADQPTGDEAEGGRGKGKSNGKGKGKVNGDSNGEVVAPTKHVGKAWKQVAPAQDGVSVFDKQSKAMAERMDGLFADLEKTSKQESKIASAPVVPIIEHHHLVKSMLSTRPSVSVADRNRLGRIYRSFVSERDGNMANGDMGRETGSRVSLA